LCSVGNGGLHGKDIPLFIPVSHLYPCVTGQKLIDEKISEGIDILFRIFSRKINYLDQGIGQFLVNGFQKSGEPAKQGVDITAAVHIGKDHGIKCKGPDETVFSVKGVEKRFNDHEHGFYGGVQSFVRIPLIFCSKIIIQG